MKATRAFMRSTVVDQRNETDLEIHSADAPYIVMVPGFGALVVAPVRSNEPIVRLGEEWIATIIQPDATGGFSDDSARVGRTPAIVDGRIEVPMLHKADRLDVCIQFDEPIGAT